MKLHDNAKTILFIILLLFFSKINATQINQVNSKNNLSLKQIYFKNNEFSKIVENCLQVNYDIIDTIDIDINSLNYYIDNLPILFQDLNNISNKIYLFSFIDSTKNEFIIKNENFQSKFEKSSNIDKTNNFTCFGLISDKFLLWKMSASIFLSINYQSINKDKILFTAKLIIFTNNSFTKEILSSKPISSLVKNKIKKEISIIKFLNFKTINTNF